MVTTHPSASTAATASIDDALVNRAIGGDRSAFEVLYQRTIRRVYNLVVRLVGSAQEAEEVTQEAYLQAYQNLNHFEGRASFFTWVYRIATNVSLQHRRRRMRRAHNLPAASADESKLSAAPSTDFNPERELERRTLYTGLLSSIARLTPAQRTVMVLGPIQGNSYEQMSGLLSVSTNVIKGRLHRARENLKGLLEELGASSSRSALAVT